MVADPTVAGANIVAAAGPIPVAASPTVAADLMAAENRTGPAGPTETADHITAAAVIPMAAESRTALAGPMETADRITAAAVILMAAGRMVAVNRMAVASLMAIDKQL